MPQPSTIPVAPEAPALLRLLADDNVSAALRPLEPGEALDAEIAEPISRGDKVALRSLECYLLAHGRPISEKPTPGNMEDGITALEETPPCAVQKAGTVMVADVQDYGARDIAIWKRGVTR